MHPRGTRAPAGSRALSGPGGGLALRCFSSACGICPPAPHRAISRLLNCAAFPLFRLLSFSPLSFSPSLLLFTHSRLPPVFRQQFDRIATDPWLNCLPPFTAGTPFPDRACFTWLLPGYYLFINWSSLPAYCGSSGKLGKRPGRISGSKAVRLGRDLFAQPRSHGEFLIFGALA